MSFLSSLLGLDVTGSEEAAAADAKLREMNAVDYGPGGKFYSPTNWTAVQDDYRAQDDALGGGPAPWSAASQQAQVNQAFNAELGLQADSFVGAPLRFLGNLVKTLLAAVPVWVWITGAVGLFLYAGGFTWLRGVLKKTG